MIHDLPEMRSRIQRPCKGKRGPEKQANRHEERFIRSGKGTKRQTEKRSDKGAQMKSSKEGKIKGLKPHHLNGKLIIQTGHKDDVIFQELHSQQGNKIERIVQWISDTRDKKLKDMLIEMGWTPPASKMSVKEFLNGKTETERLLNLRNHATKGPWEKRQHPTDEFKCFVEGPRAENMAYSCEIMGDDYNGFGDDEQRMHDVEFIASAHEMADHIERLQAELDEIKGQS